MKRFGPALLALVLLTFTAHFARAAGEEDAIKSRLDAFTTAWNNHDGNATGALWAEDGDLIDPWGKTVKGRADVQKFFTEQYAGPMHASTNHFEIQNTRVLGDVAIVDVEANLTGITGPDNKPAPDLKHHVVFVFHQNNGTWEIVAARPYVFAVMAAAATP